MVAEGSRIAYLPERFTLPEMKLVSLLQKLLSADGLVQCSGHIGVLSVNGETIIAKIDVCLNHMKSILKSISDRTNQCESLQLKDCCGIGFQPIFIDISTSHSKPVKLDDVVELEIIAKMCRTVIDDLRRLNEPIEKVKCYNLSDLEANINLCTLFGCLLGFPVIYHFNEDSNKQDKNCLNSIPLKVFKVLHDYPSSNGQCHKLELFSFSCPLELCPSVAEVIHEWKRFTFDRNQQLYFTEDSVTLPYVAL